MPSAYRNAGVWKTAYGMGLNWASPLAHKLKSCVHAFPGMRPIDLVTGEVALVETALYTNTLDGGAVTGVTGDGSTGSLDDHNYAYFPYQARFIPTGDYTILATVRPESANDASGTNDYSRRGGGSGGAHTASCGGFAALAGWNIQIGSGKPQIEAYHGTNASTSFVQYQTGTTVWPSSNGDPRTPHDIAIVRQGTGMQWWLDGKILGSSFTCPTGDLMPMDALWSTTFSLTPVPFMLGTYDGRGGSPPVHGHGGFYLAGDLPRHLIWQRALSPGELGAVMNSNRYGYLSPSALTLPSAAAAAHQCLITVLGV